MAQIQNYRQQWAPRSTTTHIEDTENPEKPANIIDVEDEETPPPPTQLEKGQK
jgi:hypothetical protein